ncbi:T9SS type A sorting domain-containing protein, partial [bacterium]|nr:T9SS type A sorting domain-containing protein [bacterium]
TTVPPDFEVTYLNPEDSVWVGCEDEEILFTVEPYVPESLIIYVNYGFYIVGVSPELSVSGDTITYTPSTPWSEGLVSIEVLGQRLFFNIDISDPMMFPIYPADGATIPISTSGIEVTYNIHDIRSGIDESGISVVIMVNALPEGSFGLAHAGVDYTGHELTFNFDDAGIDVASGDSISMIFAASDNVPAIYCGPNTRVEDLHFTVCDPDSGRHYLMGYLVDAGSGIPIEGAIVRLFHYLGGPIPGMLDTTDIEGTYSFDVYSGRYSLGAFDPISSHIPVFYLDRPDLLVADPIDVTSLESDTITLDTLHMISHGTGLFSISGTIMEEADGPIDAAYVVAISSEDDEIQDAVITGPTGDYELTVTPGDYYILGFHNDYCPSFYGGSFDYSGALEVNITTFDIFDIDFELIPIYSGGDRILWGHIFGEDDGRITESISIRGVRIYVLDALSERPVGFSVSDFNGNYNIDYLSSGTYRVFADRNGYTPMTSTATVSIAGSDYNLDIEMVPVTGIEEKPPRANSFDLGPIYPNPFNSSCVIDFSLDEKSEVLIEVFDMSGRVVDIIESGKLSPGNYITLWSPEKLPSGGYLIKMSANGELLTTKAIYIK